LSSYRRVHPFPAAGQNPDFDALKGLLVLMFQQRRVTPVTVEGSIFTGGTTSLPGNISSQYVSALLHIAPFCRKGV